MVDSSDDLFKRAGDAADEQIAKMKAKAAEQNAADNSDTSSDSSQ